MKKRLEYIDYFRGISIFGIICAHTLCWGDDAIYDTNWYLYGGAAYFFLFIAGFIFQYNSDKFEVWSFLKKRILGLFLPYICIITPLALSYSINNVPGNPFHELSFAKRFLSVFYGGFVVNPPIWIVTMIFIFFWISPLVLMLVRKY